MNPRLIKFAVELQNGEAPKDDKPKYIKFKNGGGGKKVFDILKLAKVTIPIEKS